MCYVYISPVGLGRTCLESREMDTRRDSNDVAGRANITSSQLQRDQETNNPCYKEHVLSLKCLETNQKSHDACELYFTNYKNCKNFWASVRFERKSKGIRPHLPPPEKRAKIKADYLNSR